MRTRNTACVLFLFLAIFIPKAHSAPNSAFPTSNFSVQGLKLSFDAEIADCITDAPVPTFFGSNVTPESTASELVSAPLFQLSNGTTVVRTLVIEILFSMNFNCVPSKPVIKSYVVDLPAGLSFNYLFDHNTNKFIYTNTNFSSDIATLKPPIAVHFLATRQIGLGLRADTEVIEVQIGKDGVPEVSTLARKKGVLYQIKAVARNGVVVTGYQFNGGGSSNTYLITSTAWELLSTKTIYVEPAVITTDLKTLYGRRVKDALDSTVIFAQDLKSGSTPTFFDAAKHGGGFICGVVSDVAHKYGYFTHLKSKSTDMYKIDLTTRKLSKIGVTEAGACLDEIDANGDFLAKSVNLKRLKTDAGDLMRISSKNLKHVSHYEIAESYMHSYQHSMLSFGKYALTLNLKSDIHLVTLGNNPGEHYEYIDPATLAGYESIFYLQFLNHIPPSWVNDSRRPAIISSKA